MKNLGTLKIETDRLILRRIKIEDTLDMYNNWATDKETCKYLSWDTHKDLEETKNTINKWIEKYQEDNFYHWVVVLKDTNEAVGTIGVVKNTANNEIVEIGYAYGSKWWGKGYATEALKAIIDFLLYKAEISCLQAYHIEVNPASGKVMEKCGMTKDAILHFCRIDKSTGKKCNLIYYYILNNKEK